MSPRAWSRALAVVLAVLAAVTLGGPAGASAPGFPPPVVDRIGPGVQLVTHGVRCTAAFAFRDRAGRSFLGYAARCASPAGLRAVDGCRHRSWPLGTQVRVASDAVGNHRGRTLARGVLRYSSWLAMHRAGTHDRLACRNNDFALVQVLGRASSRVSPTLDFWDGPDAMGTVPDAGNRLLGCSGQVVSGVRTLVPGALHVRQAWRWGAAVSRATGLGSDVGAGLVDERGRAAGILLADHAGRRTRVASLGPLVRFAQRHGMPGLVLLPGRSPFHAYVVV